MNKSPFKLNVLLAKNKIMMIARGGDIASIDIVVPAKNTGIAPGPMLTEFKEAGIPTKIDQGTIWIAKDSTPVLKYLKWCVERQLIKKGRVLPPNEDGKFVFYSITQRGKEFLELIS